MMRNATLCGKSGYIAARLFCRKKYYLNVAYWGIAWETFPGTCPIHDLIHILCRDKTLLRQCLGKPKSKVVTSSVRYFLEHVLGNVCCLLGLTETEPIKQNEASLMPQRHRKK